ncbi:aldose 1-epimerase [Neisseria sp. ZJ106]|uniref:Aldose 1-epimerase n=1 Tax=Neisseria lisongii TaxID=2912188 RepID=A0ABY7RL84_9NEIS|nr:aldose 1-epimerase [Neisseria lisongii]MCF7521817.1 aldose 1-epimerase [Neisseria lisongii]WCL72192.1 aldose 1-epimerase [Neisseria lisongii]
MFDIQTDNSRIILNHQGRRRAEIYLFGALLNRYEIELTDGSRFNAVQGYENPQQARETLTAGFHSAKLSPFACRIRCGQYRFDGQEYCVGKHQIAGHAAHGLMYDADFALIGSGSNAESAWAELAADYRAQEAGFPFAYRLQIRYCLTAQGLETVTLVRNTGRSAMPLADGWHPYFTLGGSVDEWTLQLNSRSRLVFDQDLVANGEILADNRFANARSLAGIELDNSFILDSFDRPACILRSSNYRLSIFPEPSYPYLQIYIPPARQSLALENLSGAPDCFNNGLGLTVLAAGEEKRFATRYVLETCESEAA